MKGEFDYRALERVALAFVLESENWLEFVEWAWKQAHSVEFHEWLYSKPDLAELRKQWIANSPDPMISSLADLSFEVGLD